MNEAGFKKLLLGAGIALILLFYLSPVIWMAVVSLSKNADFLSRGRIEITCENFKNIFRERTLYFPFYLKNSLIVGFFSALFATLFGGLAAYILTRTDSRLKKILMVGVLAVSMFPQISLAGYLFRMMTSAGLINTYTALILPYISWCLPFALWILMGYFSQIPRDIDAAALIDGADRFRAFSRIIVPLALPGLLSTFLLVFIFAFNEFLFALMLTTDHNARTVPVGISLFEGLHGELPWGNIMAASLISALPLILLALFFQRYIFKGLSGGAVKQ